MAWRDQWDTLADKYRNDTHDEVVDHAFVQEGRDDVPTAHQPDVLALFLLQALREGANGGIDEFNASRHRCRWRLSRKHVVAIECGAQLHADLVRLAAQHLRVDRPHELSHSIESLGSWAACQPFEVAVWSGDITVRAGCDVDDNLPLFNCDSRHGWI